MQNAHDRHDVAFDTIEDHVVANTKAPEPFPGLRALPLSCWPYREGFHRRKDFLSKALGDNGSSYRGQVCVDLIQIA